MNTKITKITVTILMIIIPVLAHADPFGQQKPGPKKNDVIKRMEIVPLQKPEQPEKTEKSRPIENNGRRNGQGRYTNNLTAANIPLYGSKPWPTNSILYKDHYLFAFTEELTWNDAKKACEQKGGKLAVFILNKEQVAHWAKVRAMDKEASIPNFRPIEGDIKILKTAFGHLGGLWVGCPIPTPTLGASAHFMSSLKEKDKILSYCFNQGTIIWEGRGHNKCFYICEWDIEK